MYNESYELMTAAAVKKVDFLKKNPTGYILLSIIAGAFIGLGVMIMIFWCILIFVACGGEHTVANMTMLTVGLAKGGIAVSGYFYNILLAAIGNIVGGALCIALPYHLIGKEKNN